MFSELYQAKGGLLMMIALGFKMLVNKSQYFPKKH